MFFNTPDLKVYPTALGIFDKASFTIPEIFEDVAREAEKIAKDLDSEELGDVQRYIDIIKELANLTKQSSIDPKEIRHCLNKFDGGLHKQDKIKYPYSVPLVRTKGELLFANLIVACFQGIIDNFDNLDVWQYSWLTQIFINIGFKSMLEPRVEYLKLRIRAYNNQQQAQSHSVKETSSNNLFAPIYDAYRETQNRQELTPLRKMNDLDLAQNIATANKV